jgi:hypothetical protein
MRFIFRDAAAVRRSTFVPAMDAQEVLQKKEGLYKFWRAQ